MVRIYTVSRIFDKILWQTTTESNKNHAISADSKTSKTIQISQYAQNLRLPDLPYFTGDPVFQTPSPTCQGKPPGRTNLPYSASQTVASLRRHWHVKTLRKITIWPIHKDLVYSVSSQKIQWGWALAIWQLDSVFDTVYVWPSVRQSICPISRTQQRRTAGLLLSAVRAKDIDRQRPAAASPQPGAH